MPKLRVTLTLLLLTALVVASDYCGAATPITITTIVPGKYLITATNLPDAAGMDLSITYNEAFLKDPIVSSAALTPSGSVMMVPNTATPGFIRIGFITGGSIKGSGEIALISFTKIKDPAPQPLLATPNVYSATGTQLAVESKSSDASLPSPETKNETDTVKETKITSNSGGGSTIYSGGGVPTATAQVSMSPASVSVPQETGIKNELLRQDFRKDALREDPYYQSVPADISPVTVGGLPNSGRAVDAVVVAESKTAALRQTLKSSPSVIDRFRAYKGVRTVKLLSALFDDNATVMLAAGIVQLPAIVVTDGKVLVTVEVDLANDTTTPSFSLKGANLKSIRRVSDNKWELDALPQKNRSDVRLSIIKKGDRIEIPLVAVPPLQQPAAAEFVALSGAALDLLLAKPLKSNKLVYDLNSDGKQDYLDDYILVANWLLNQQKYSTKVGQKPVAAGK